jgi:cytochrome c oxidase subunit 4
MSTHVASRSVYYATFAALLILLLLTLLAARFDLGRLSLAVAMLIAVVKAALIVVYFMHVRHGSSLVRAFAAAGFLWLAILLTLAMADYLTRDAATETTGGGGALREQKPPSVSPWAKRSAVEKSSRVPPR